MDMAMENITGKKIISWLKKALGNDETPSENPLWIEHEYAFGDTEAGFYSAYTINYDALEREIDKWISETFRHSINNTDE